MNRFSTIACALALAAVATAAHADPVFDRFKVLCFDTHARMDGALAEADKLGWIPAPESTLSPFKPVGDVQGIQGRVTKTTTGVEMLVVARGKSLGDLKLDADLCAILAAPADGSGLKAAAAKFAAVDPDVTLKETGSVGYIWRDGPGGRQQVAPAALKAGSGDPGVRAMMVYGDASRGLILLIVPTQVSPN